MNKWSTISRIIWSIENGMYRDYYTVYYKSGYKRIFYIKAEMIESHFNYIITAKVKPIYNKNTNKHTADIFYKEW